ncbi:Holliday junction resolvase RuvX [Glutamicibacter uratoxydans]|uniref:Holliday junction resolvase RuvX n=1 Tax=Glutamicibacter uratoxydans TaxID=43667 RepID=UPI003D6E25C6
MASNLLGVDVGNARVGVAVAASGGVLALPVQTLRRDMKKNSDRRILLKMIVDREVSDVYIGEPKSLSGNLTESTKMARDYAICLAEEAHAAQLEVGIWLIDERLSTVSAHRALHEAGRKSEKHRAVVDQAAAVEILQQVLEMQRNQVRIQASRVVVR